MLNTKLWPSLKRLTLSNGLLFIVLALLLINQTAAALSLTEQQVINQVSQNQKEQLFLLEKLVNINSGTTNISGVHQVGEILRPQFEQLGFNKTKWVEEPASLQRAGTLIAERQGTKGKRLLLIGHLDTVFPKESTFQRFEQHQNLATGPGVIDDKGGDVIISLRFESLEGSSCPR